ncbi:PBECR2 nuclease fold domain-containing protein [Paramuribaculum intestinale]|uniref:LPD3 domain-containing protein n=1 Tax=Paramuribaculum intestinale TaxID=2094151 RepID=UPI0025B76BBC|nr:PBECR2 nuclease fold domain-containing protein [Paramuribaculum intestinale]
MSGKTDKRRLSAAEVLSGGEMVKPASMRDIVAMESAMVMPEVTSLPTSGEEMAALMGRASGADKANKTNGADKANGTTGADTGTRSVDDSEVVDAHAEPMRGLYDALRADGCSLPEYGEFRTWMGEEANRRKLYDALRADGCSLPYDYNEFAKAISYQPNIDGMRSAVARGEEAMGDILALGRHNIESAMELDRRRGVDPVDVAEPVSGGVGVNPSTGLPEQKYLTGSGAVYGKGDATLAAQSDWAGRERAAEQQSVYDEVDATMIDWDAKNPKASKEERNAMMKQVYDRTVWRRRMDEIDREIAGAERQRDAIADQLRVAWRESPGAQYREIMMREGREAADAYMQSVMADGLDAANAKEDALVRRSADLSQRLNLANIRLRALRDAKERYERGEEHRESAAPWGTPMGIWQDAKDYTMGFAHGVKNVVTNPLGMVGAFDALATANILDKLERREDLTEDEEALLDATVFGRSTDAFSGSKGIAYQVGEFVPEIAEMAAEFGFSPMSGATRAVCAQGIKRLGIHGFKQLLRHPKFMAKVAGTATLEGASIAATTQAAKNYTEMVGRMVGDPVRDSEGKIRWISGGDSMGEAFAKTAVRAVGSNAVFVLPTNVGGSLLKAMESGEVGKIITKLARSTKYLPWHNPVDALVKMKTSELFSVALGDETWDDYTDKEANAVLLGSVLAAEMTSNGPRAAKAAAQYGSTKYFERRMKGAYFRARSLFEQRGGEKAGEAWDRLTDRLTTLDTESAVNLATALKMMSEGKRAVDGEAEALMRGTTVTTDEAAAFFDFVRAMVGYQSQYCRRRAGGYSWTFEDSTSYNTGGFERDKPQRRIAETATRSFDEGFDAPPSDLDVTRRAAAEARQRVVDQYGEEYASMIDSDPIGFLESRPEDDMSLEMEYINLKARQSGIEARISTTESEAVDAANAEECRRINRQSGMVVRVRVGADEETAREAYVVSGNVSVTADGLPDRSASDGMLVVMDAESGKLEYCSPDRLFSVEEMRAPRLELSEESPELSEAADGEVEADVVDKADVTNEANVSDGGMPSEAHGFKINDTTEVGVLGSDELQSGMVIDVMSDGRLVVWTSQPVDESSVELAEGDGLVGYATEMVPRQQDNVAEADMSEAVSGAESAGGGVEGDMIGRSLSPRESTDLIARMESGAEVAPEVELTPENWISQFGEDGTVETPLGTVKMGDNQYFKLAQQGRDGKLGMVKPTLQRPDIIIEDYRPAANSERDTSFIFVKTFNKSDGSRFYYFTSVTVSKGGREVVISNQEKSGKRISKLLQQGKVAWINNSSLHPNTQVGKPVSLNDSNTPTNSDNEGALLGIDSSADGKVRENAGDMQAGDSALSRIAVDKDGKPMYESAPSDVAWDAIVERAGGDTAIAGEVAAEMVASAREALSAAEQALKEIRDGGGANKTAGRGGRKGDKASAQRPMDADDLIAAKLDARAKEAEAMQAVDAARERLAKWEEIASVASSREVAARAEVEKAEREEAEARAREEARLRAEDEVRQQREREELEGVPDFSIDKPEDARRRGFVRVAGAKIERQQPLPAGHPGYGREVEPMFASGSKPVRAKGRVLITEVDEYQPSHVDGRINPAHMIPEAQPKARHKDGGVSLNTAEQNAKNIDPRLVTRTEDPYTGAPVVNRHREGVQGNGRLQMLRLLYDKFPEKGEVYKQYLIDHAEAFGVDPDYIRSLKRPAMAIEIEGDDARAIELGQMTSQDNESGGIERIRPKHTARKMGDDMGKFAAMLMNDPGDGEASFAELVTQNGAQTLDWMNRNGYISDTQKSSALRADGRLTEDAVKDLKDILYQNIFDGAPTRMEEMFAALPAKAQKAILATAYRDHSSPESERLVPEIQDAITASYMLRSYGLFAEAKNPEACRRAIESWKAQSTIDDLGNVVFPAEIFSNFALELAARFKGDTQKQIQTLLVRILDAVQGRTEDLFAEGPVKPKTVAEAIKEVTGIDYNPKKSKRNGKDVDDRDALLDRGDQNGEVGRPAGGGTLARGEHDQAGAGTSERGRGADGVRPEPGVRSSEQSEGSESAGGDVDKADKSDVVNGGEPTAAQKEAGNYKKEHRRIDGYRISIENAKGSVRRGTDASGDSWEVTMQNDYGYIRGTEGVDGDHIDVFLSDTPEVGDVFVVDQVKPDGTFDEHKVMYGFGSEAEARQAYLSNYSPGWRGLGAITRVSKEEFKKWVNSSKRKTKPFADYHTIKKEVLANSQGSVAENKNIRTESSEQSEPSEGSKAGGEMPVTDVTDTNQQVKSVPKLYDRSIPTTREEQRNAITRIIDFAKKVKDRVERAVIGGITKRQKDDFAKFGIDIDDSWVHSFETSAVSHNQKHHGNPTVEAARGQIAITAEDYNRIPDILDHYDKISKSPNKTKGTENDVIIYEKEFDDGYVFYLEEKRDNRKSLAFHTMYKKKKGTDSSDGFAVNSTAPITPKATPDNLDSISEGKGSGLFDDLQEGDGEKPSVIEDFGEKIAGARKDMLHDLAKSVENVTVQSLIELPLGKAFKKPNLKKMSESGAISDSDAMLAEAVMQALIFGRKKPAASRRMNSKREISEWAQSTYDGIRFLGEILSGDVSRRDKALADRRAMMADRLAKANAHIENLRQWNPDKQFEYHESLPDEVEVIRNVLERIGYRAGDAVSLPLCRISISSNGKSYEVQSAGKQGAFWFKRHHDTLESAIKTMELAARLKRGDMEAELTARDFIVSGQGNQRMESSGQYEVLYFTKRNQVASKIFDNEADASAFAQSNGGRVREMKRCTNEYDGYQATVVNPLTGNRHPIGEVMPTRGDVSAWLDSNHEEANRQGLEAIYAEIGTKRSSREHFYIGTSYDRDAGKVVYSVIEDDKSNPWPIKKEFSSRNEAEAWLKDNMSRLEEERKIRKEKERQMVYFNPSGDRRGPDHRQGNAATPEMFADTFGFRGVQFGNWTSGADRQAALDQAYDALMDMAGVLGLTPRAMSLDGELGLAFGARGGGAASAHYEPGAVVINLTKTKGAGALAHEWWHALDNYLARHGGVPLGHVTDGHGLDQLRPEVRAAIGAYMQAVDGSEYARRSRDKGDYWGRSTEVGARLFESWIDYKLNGAGEHSPFLASGLNPDVESLYRRLNYMAYRGQERARAESRGVAPQVMSEEEFNSRPESLRGYPYPTKSELESFDGAVSGVLSALADRESQTGSMAQERRGRYRRMAVGRSLFDAVEESERSKESAAAEQANNAIDAFAASYSEYLERSEELENMKAESDRGDRMAELQEQMEREDALISEHRALLEESLRDFYVRNNTPEDAAEIARQMVARAQAEVEVRRNGRQILRDIAGGSGQSESSARLEAEQTEAAGGQVKTAGGVISYNALGHLPDPANGEFGLVERQMSLIGEFGFTGNSSVKDRGDVAYIFRALEDYSIEHVFVAFQKGESLKVMHIGMGGPTQSFADLGAIRAGYDAFGADKIYLIHNHPTGKLLASVPDQKLMSTLEAAFPDIDTEGIIMDTTSGRYGTFHGMGATESHERPQAGGDSEVGVMRIDRAKRDKDRLPEMPVIRSSADVASYVGGQRLGGGDKVSFLVLANDNRIVANFHTGYGSLGDPGLADELASVATKWGGTSVIVYGNVDVRGASALKSAVTSKSLGGVRLLDAMEITNGLNRSAMDEGYLREGRPAAYGEGEVREPAMSRGLMDFEATRERALAERGLVMPGLNKAKVRVVDVPRHDFSGDRPIAQAKAWAKANLIGEHYLTDSDGREVEYSISNRTISKYFSESAIDNSENLGVHLSVLKKLPEVISESVEAEVHPDYHKGEDGKRAPENGHGEDKLIHRFYGAVTIDGEAYRVKTTIAETRENKLPITPHSFEVTEIELLTDANSPKSLEPTVSPKESGVPHRIAKLLNGVEKSYDPGVQLLDASEKSVNHGYYDSYEGEGIGEVREPAMSTGSADFEATRERALAERGLVMPGLNKAKVRVVDVPRHDFSGDRPIAQAKAWAKANLIGEHYLTDSKGREVEYSISGKSIEKYLSESAISKSDDIGIHLSALKKLPEIIGESVECEIHPSYNKIDGHRLSDNGYNNDLLVHRFYGAIAHEGNVYRVKTTLIEHLDAKTSPHPHAYEVAKIEVLPDYSGNTSIGGAQAYTPTKRGTLQTTKILKGVEKSYDPGVKLLDASRKEDVRAMIGEHGDPLKDRVLKAALYMAGKDEDNIAARDAAVKAIGKRVGNIRKAMRAQKEYDASTVGEIRTVADAMLESGLLDEMSGGEVKRLLGAMAVSVEKGNLRVATDRLLDLVIDNQVRLSKDMLDKALRVKGSKTNAAGVRVGAKLDPMGQQMVKAAREGIEALTEDGVAERIQYLYNEIGEATKAKNDDLKAEYQAMLTGMEIARGYHADVKAKDRAISDLNFELTKLLRTWSDLETKEERDCYRQEKRALEEAIRTLKSEKADGLREVAGAIMGGVGESMERMKAWREAEQARIDHIHHMANADMEGTPISAHERPKLKGMGRLIERTLNSSLGEFLLGPTATFEQMMRLFASHSIDGRGYVYERFIPGWMECNDRRWKNQRAQEERLNAKAKEVAGVKRWSGLYEIGKQPAGTISWRDGGEMKEFVITQDNLMYVYMANKMEDGIMKLRGMGISEEVMEEVVKRLDPRLKKLADWVQEEFLPSNKGRYNDVHKRMFNAPMAEVENYFPLKVLADARQQDMEIKADATGSTALPRTVTGAIIERTKNNLPLDILRSSAISIVLDNLRDMEEWAAFAEYRRDVGTLLSYTRFRNQVKNTKSIYGSGDNLWNKMVKLALITCGAYERKQSDLDKAAVNLAKGVTGACIAFRLNTALKQLLSLPAFASEANAIRMMAALRHPIKSWRWSMENLPSLQERWISRQAGNELLKVCKDDWSIYDKKWIKAIGRAGISPNAFIDAVTVAIGSKAVYESKYNEYVKAGWSAEVSRKKAILDAEIAFNLSQQSSLAPFMSIMQSDRTLGSTMLTIFRNSPMSYLRQQVQATREINNYIRDHGQMDYEVKKLQREGLPEEKAKAYANKKRKRVIAKNLFRLLNFGFILPGLWAMGGAMWYLMAGDDKEQKQEILEDAAIRGLYGTLDGVTLGGMIPDMIFNYFHKDEPSRLRDTSLLPFEQEASGAVDALTGNNPWKGVHKTINLLSQMFSGGNPQLVEDWVVAGMDFFGADEKNGEEWALLGMRIFQVPQSQLDMIYLDKLGLWSDEARKEPPAKLARRWAHYKATRSNITGALAMSAEKWAEEEEKQRKRFNKMAKELLEGADKSGYREKFEAYNDEYMRIDAEYKDLMSKRKRGDVDRSAIYDRLRELKSTDEYKRYERFAKLKGAYDSSVDRWLDAATPEATLEALEYHETTKRLLVEIMDNKNLDSVMEAAAELADMERRQKRRDLGWDD